MSLPIGSVVTDVALESLSATNQSNTPITFGQVFKAGDMLAGESLVGRIGKSDIPLQYEVKATHADGSVRHAVISMVLPSLPAKTLPVMQLVKVAPSDSTVGVSTPTTASVSATIAGVKYVATVDNTHLPNKTWLAGAVAQEKHFNVPLTAGDGTVHPHLFARFALRDYAVIGNVRVDAVVENNWAYVALPQNYTYDLEIQVNSNVVYSQIGLTHLNQGRWRRIFWSGDSPSVNVRLNTVYLIASKAFPNYDTTYLPNEASLNRYVTASVNSGPMQIGAASPYFPTTGGNDEIGLNPAWAIAWLLSMDKRARDCTLITANGAGSYPAHYRDQKTDRPVSLFDYPYMTLEGNPSDTWNDAEKRYESFPTAGGDVTNPYTPDISHQPDLVSLAYLLTGDYYYLEELQFWAMYDTFRPNPNYRGIGLGLVHGGELRAQAWAMRTLFRAAAFTPDDDPLKVQFVAFVNNNLDWYNSNYPLNLSANQMGVMPHDISFAYGASIAPWMDDFFTSAIGHGAELGFDKAVPLLKWKALFSVGRMTAPGVCWTLGCPYGLKMRDGSDSSSPLYASLAQCYAIQFGDIMALPCGSAEMGARVAAQAGDMGNIPDGYMGYPSNMQPALAYSVDTDISNGQHAWDLFMSRTIKPDYTQGQQFNIVPRTYTAAYIAPIIVEGWQQIALEGQTATVAADTTVRFGADTSWITKVVTGEVIATNDFFGGDPAPNVVKTLQKFIPAAPNPPIEGNPIMTYKVSVALSFANQTLPAGTEAASTSTLVEILDLTGAIVASSSSVYEFSGINAGDYVVRASGIDSKGAVMGVPYSQGFSIVDAPVVTDPTPVDPAPTDPIPVEPAPQPVDVSLPSGVTVSYVKE